MLFIISNCPGIFGTVPGTGRIYYNSRVHERRGGPTTQRMGRVLTCQRFGYFFNVCYCGMGVVKWKGPVPPCACVKLYVELYGRSCVWDASLYDANLMFRVSNNWHQLLVWILLSLQLSLYKKEQSEKRIDNRSMWLFAWATAVVHAETELMVSIVITTAS